MNFSKRLVITAGFLAVLFTALVVGFAQDPKKPPLVTFDQILKCLKDKDKEEEILKRVEESPTKFTFDAAQVKSLKDAGASEKFITALEKKGLIVAPGSDVRAFVIILDCSGSMKDKIEGGATKWDEARKAAIQLVQSIPEGRDLAVIVYGRDLKKACADVEVLRPLGPLVGPARAKIIDALKDSKPSGGTPIALSLKMADVELAKTKDLAKLILITDGMQSPECKADGAPESVAADLAKKYPNLHGGLDVVGFGLSQAEVEAVEKIAKSGRGEFHEANNAKDLEESVKDLKDKLTKPRAKASDSQFNHLRDIYSDRGLAKELAERVLAAARPKSSDSGKVVDRSFEYNEKEDRATYKAKMTYTGATSGNRYVCHITVECKTSTKNAWVVTAIKFDDDKDNPVKDPSYKVEELRKQLNSGK